LTLATHKGQLQRKKLSLGTPPQRIFPFENRLAPDQFQRPILILKINQVDFIFQYTMKIKSYYPLLNLIMVD
jgi:hypothetical protein